LQSLICEEYKYRKISIFVSNSPTYQNALTALLTGEFCSFNILSQYTVSVRQTNFKREIAHAKSTGVRIFVLLTDSFVSSHLVHEGSHAGLFGEGRQVFGHADIFEYVDVHDHHHDGIEEENDIMYHGFIGVRELPNYALSLTPAGKDFMSRWRRQTATNGTWLEGERRCDMSRDDNDAFLLFASPPNFQYTYNCAGLDFSSFDEDGHDIVDYTPHTYDAALLLAHAYHKLIYVDDIDLPTIQDLSDTIFDLAFDGASGRVAIHAGDVGRGTRRIGQYFEVLNYVGISHEDREHHMHVMSVNVSAPNHHRIGTWELQSGFTPCYDMGDEGDDHDHDDHDHTHRHLSITHTHVCEPPIYNSHNGAPVSESPAPFIYHQERVGFQVLGAVLACVAVAFLLFVAVNWNHLVIKNSVCGMLPDMAIGCLMSAARIIIMSAELNEGLCVTQGIAFHVSFVMFFLPVILSSIRTYIRSLYPEKLRKWLSQFNMRMAYFVISTVILGIVVVTLWVMRGSYYGYESTRNNNQETRYPNCISDTSSFSSSLTLGIEAALLLFGLVCAYNARNVRDATLESKTNFGILSVFCGMVFVVFPIWLLLDVGPYVRVNIAEYNIAGVMLFCLLLLYTNRRDMLKKFMEDEEYFSKSVSEMAPSIARSKSVSAAYCLYKTLTRDEQVRMCKTQISKWVDTLMQLRDPVRGISLTQVHGHTRPKIEFAEGTIFPFGKPIPLRANAVLNSNFDASSLGDIPEEGVEEEIKE